MVFAEEMDYAPESASQYWMADGQEKKLLL